MKVISILRKSGRFLIFAAVFSVLVQDACAQRHDDSVTSGRSKVGRQINIGSNFSENKEVIDGAFYLMKNVPMRSTTLPFQHQTVSFGPYKNNSKSSLRITLSHIGGGEGSISVGYVDGLEVIRSPSASTFSVPPGSSYHWQVKSEHSITASVPVKSVLLSSVGLPTESDFLSPKRNSPYIGCMYIYAYAYEGSTPEKVGAKYYYAAGPMSDLSDAWDTLFSLSPFESAKEGPPLNGGGEPCLDEVNSE